jgi:hypothetical protein
LIGAKASELLSAPECTGRVLAVVSKAVYLTGPGDEILWLAQEQLPAHSRSILGSFDLTALCDGLPFRRDAQRACLQFGNQASVDLADASVWKPGTIQPGQLMRQEIVSARVRQLFNAVQSLDCGDSLGQVIPLVRAISDGGDATGVSSSSPLITLAFPPISEIARACRVRDMTRAVKAGRALVGLGPGLTPSGDDFLGGLFFVAHHLQVTYREELDWNRQPIDNLVSWARTQTNPISHSILCDHAHGHAAEPLHDLVAAMLTGKDLDAILMDVRRLLEIGSTSGWDMFAGTMTGLLLLTVV